MAVSHQIERVTISAFLQFIKMLWRHAKHKIFKFRSKLYDLSESFLMVKTTGLKTQLMILVGLG